MEPCIFGCGGGLIKVRKQTFVHYDIHTCAYVLCHFHGKFMAKFLTGFISLRPIIPFVKTTNEVKCRCCSIHISSFKKKSLFISKTLSSLILIWVLSSRSVNLTLMKISVPQSKWNHMIRSVWSSSSWYLLELDVSSWNLVETLSAVYSLLPRLFSG